MFKRVACAVLAAGFLSGCEEMPPDPAVVAMSQQCQAGNQAACANYAQMRQAQMMAGAAIMSQPSQPTTLPYVLGSERPRCNPNPAAPGGMMCY